jgi:Ca2+-binding RTX toxin-like protein
MRQVVTLVTVCLVHLVLGPGAVWAATLVTCPGGECLGTLGSYIMIETIGNDAIAGFRGEDDIVDTAQQNRDSVAGGRGNDTIDVRKGNKGLVNRDFVNCGDGRDALFFDEGNDTVVGCEKQNPN